MQRLLDSLLNRVSMYRLVSIMLTALWAASFFLALSGMLDIPALAIAISGAIALVVCYLTNRLFGLLVGIRPHGESAYISGLIIFCLFTPSFNIQSLIILALASGLAMASKYLIVWRGRHIFNPTALSVAVLSLSGLGFSSWWIATPPLFPLILLSGLLLAYKTRRLLFGSIFLVTALTITAITMLSHHVTLSVLIGLLLSWPLLFFTVFMLSEPLTLPPKKWQQYTEAVVVALLATLPLRVGDFSISLALALVLGNLLAFVWTRRRGITLVLKERRALTPTTDELVFTPTRPVSFLPGQYIELTLPHSHSDWRGLRRLFSVTSIPGTTDVRLGVKFYQPSSSFKSALRQLPVGAQIQTTGVSGSFTLPKNHDIPLLLIAGGIGITPFISQLQTLKARDEQRNVILIYSISSPEELAYRDVLEASGIPVVIVTPGQIPDLPAHWRHYDDHSLPNSELTTIISGLATRRAYISGPPTMVHAYKHQLHAHGILHIHTDYFTGY